MRLMLSKWSLSTYMFLTLTLFGTILAISSPHWMGAWIGLEINLIGFLPLLVQRGATREIESGIKYLMPQMLASSLLLTGSMLLFISTQSFNITEIEATFQLPPALDGPASLSSPHHNLSMYLITLSLVLKLGAAPFHFWLPSAMAGMSWVNCMFLATLQKIAPLVLLSNMQEKPVLMLSIFASIGAIIGGVGGLNQTNLRALLAYSSINHLSWMLMAMIYSHLVMIIYLIIYTLTSILLLSFLSVNEWSQVHQFSSKSTTMNGSPLLFIMLMLSLGGTPPMLGFFGKFLVIYTAINSHLNNTPLWFLIAGSMMSLYYYLTLLFTFMLENQILAPTYSKFKNTIYKMGMAHMPLLMIFELLGLALLTVIIISMIALPLTLWKMAMMMKEVIAGNFGNAITKYNWLLAPVMSLSHLLLIYSMKSSEVMPYYLVTSFWKEPLKGQIKQGMKKIFNLMPNPMKKLFGWIKQLLKKLFNRISDFMKKLLSWTTKWLLKKLFNLMPNFMKKLLSWIKLQTTNLIAMLPATAALKEQGSKTTTENKDSDSDNEPDQPLGATSKNKDSDHNSPDEPKPPLSTTTEAEVGPSSEPNKPLDTSTKDKNSELNSSSESGSSMTDKFCSPHSAHDSNNSVIEGASATAGEVSEGMMEFMATVVPDCSSGVDPLMLHCLETTLVRVYEASDAMQTTSLYMDTSSGSDQNITDLTDSNLDSSSSETASLFGQNLPDSMSSESNSPSIFAPKGASTPIKPLGPPSDIQMEDESLHSNSSTESEYPMTDLSQQPNSDSLSSESLQSSTKLSDSASETPAPLSGSQDLNTAEPTKGQNSSPSKKSDLS